MVCLYRMLQMLKDKKRYLNISKRIVGSLTQVKSLTPVGSDADPGLQHHSRPPWILPQVTICRLCYPYMTF